MVSDIERSHCNELFTFSIEGLYYRGSTVCQTIKYQHTADYGKFATLARLVSRYRSVLPITFDFAYVEWNRFILKQCSFAKLQGVQGGPVPGYRSRIPRENQIIPRLPQNTLVLLLIPYDVYFIWISSPERISCQFLIPYTKKGLIPRPANSPFKEKKMKKLHI